MKFYLDHNVATSVAAALRNAHHVVVTSSEAGRAADPDMDQVIFADDHNYVLLTHDRELEQSRHDLPIGRIVRLQCVEPLAAALIVDALPIVVPQLEAATNITMRISRASDAEINVTTRYGTEHT